MRSLCLGLALCGALLAQGAAALEWSDNAIGYRYGERFSEPYNDSAIAKSIVNLTHVDGYRYGRNYFNLDVLLSDSNDSPTRSGVPSREGAAREWYLVYRHTFDFGRLLDRSLAVGPVRGFGFTAGFDLNNKQGDSYESRKRMLVAGPTIMFEVPGFLDVSLLMLRESNGPLGHRERYTYADHPMLGVVWGIPLTDGAWPLSFSGYGNWIAGKGVNEFGGATRPETNIDMQLMADVSGPLGLARRSLLAGVGYQYWRNKFGNDHAGPAGPGAFARTPMLRAEIHF